MGVGSVISSISTLGGLAVVWISLKLKLNGLNVDLSVVVVLWVVVLGSCPTRPSRGLRVWGRVGRLVWGLLFGGLVGARVGARVGVSSVKKLKV